MADLSPEELAILQKNGIGAPSPQPSGSFSDEENAILQKNGIMPNGPSPASVSPKPNDSPFGSFKKGGSGRTLWQDFLEPGGDSPNKPLDTGGVAQALGYPGGLTSTAVMEGLKRIASGGDKGVGAKEWQNALQGNASGIPQGLQGMGMGPIASHVVGIPLQAITDPFASIMAGGASEAKPAANVMSALKQQVQTAVPGGQAIGDLIQGSGKKIFQNAFRKTDSNLSTKYKMPAKTYSDLLWNKGKPLVGGSNEDIQQAATDLRKGVGSQIGDTISAAGGDQTFHLAPELEQNAQTSIAVKAGIPEAQAGDEASRITWIREELGRAADLPDPADRAKAIDKVATLAQSLDTDPYQHVKDLIANRKTRQEGIDLLAESVPDLTNKIKDNAKHLGNSNTRDGVLKVYNALIDDLAEGPRSLDALQSMKKSLQDVAAGSEPMGQNVYATTFKANQPKSAAADFASGVGNHIDDIVDNRLNTSGVTNDAWGALKKRYSILRKGELPTRQALGVTMSRTPVTWTDALAGILGGTQIADHPAILPSLVGAKVAKELIYSPSFAVKAAKGLNAVGNTNLWDNMLRQEMLNSIRSKDNGAKK